jgi:hypothetical protein
VIVKAHAHVYDETKHNNENGQARGGKSGTEQAEFRPRVLPFSAALFLAMSTTSWATLKNIQRVNFSHY